MNRMLNCAVLLAAALALPHAAAEDRYLAVHSAADLLALPLAATGSTEEGVLDDAALEAAIRGEILELSDRKNSVACRDGGVLIIGSLDAHAQVNEFLHRVRSWRDAAPSFEILIASAPIDLLRCVGESSRIQASPNSRPMMLLTSEEHTRLLAALAESPMAQTIEHMQTGATNGARVGCKHTMESAYVEDFDVIVSKNFVVGDPKIGTIQAGYVLWLTPDGRDASGATLIDLDFSACRYSATSELRTEWGMLDLPETACHQFVESLAIPSDRSLLISGLINPLPFSPRGGVVFGSLLVLVRPRVDTAAYAPPAPLAWASDPDELAARKLPEVLEGEPTLTLHDVRDLTGPLQDFPGPNVEIANDEETEAIGAAASDPAVVAEQSLVDWIRASILPESWSVEGATLEIRNRTLVVRQQPAALRLVEKFLADLRHTKGLLVTISIRILSADASVAGQIETAGLRMGDRVLEWGSEVDPEPLLAMAEEEDSGFSLLTAPSLTAWAGQRANISILNQASYVSDYDIESDGESLVCDPVVGVLQDGLVVETRTVPKPDRSAIVLELDVLQSKFLRPFRERKLPVGQSEVTVQLPDVEHRQSRRSMQIADGATVLLSAPGIAGVPHVQKEQQVLILVSATITALDEQMPPRTGPR